MSVVPHRPVATLCQPAAPLIVAEGVPLFDVAKILGHSTIAVTMRYAHFAPEAGRAGIEKLGRALDAKPLPSGGVTGATGVAETATKYDMRRSA